MTAPAIFRREECLSAMLDFGTTSMDVADYATTGLRVIAVGPSGVGKTNVALLLTEQLTAQGWVAVLMDPEGELEALHGPAVRDEATLARRLTERDRPIVVVRVRDTGEFVPYARVVLEAANTHRRPIFLAIDEAQIFSAPRKRQADLGEASDLVNDLVQRGRKRSLDLFLSAHRFTGSLHRNVFANANLKFVGRQEDPTAWSALAPQFKGSRITYPDLAALAPGQFFCFSRRGVERVTMPMAAALAAVAPKATAVKPVVPATYQDWDRALRAISTPRLEALTSPVAGLLGAIAGLSTAQFFAGNRALRDELEARG